MSGSWNYIHSSVEKIDETLTKAYAAVETPGVANRVAAKANLIVISSGTSSVLPREIETLIGAFSEVHPCRFFVFCFDRNAEDVRVDVAVHGHLVSGTDRVCSEIIKVTLAPSRLRSFQSVLRANLLVGMPTELFVTQSLAGSEALDLLLPMSDFVLFDSSDFEESLETLSRISRGKIRCFDFEWVRLAPWRDQVRQLFDLSVVGSRLGELRTIEVCSRIANPGRIGFGGMLIGAWLAERLRAEPVAYGSSGYECVRENGEVFRIGVSSEQSGASPCLSRIDFNFETGRVRVERGERLDTIVEFNPPFRMARPFDDGGLRSIVKRYYLIGESTSNYDGALRSSLEMVRLRQGFNVM